MGAISHSQNMDSQKSILITLFIIIVSLNSKNIVHVNAIDSPSAVPSTSECMDLLMNNMVTCVTFLSKGSTDTKPDPSCCSGLKVVLGTKAECLCVALKSSASFGIDIDFGRAATLTSGCNIQNAPPISKCNELGPPGSSSSPPSEQPNPNKNSSATPTKQPTPPPPQPTPPPPTTPPTAPSPSPPAKSSKMVPSSSPSATPPLGPSSPPPSTPKTGSSPPPPSPPASPTTGPSPSSSSLAPSKIPPMGASSPLPQSPIATTMVPLPSPSSDDATTTSPPTHSSSSSSVSIIVPYVMIASCNIFLYFFA